MEGTKAWRKRGETGQRQHGLGTSTDLAGNVSHLVSPVIGMIRAADNKGEVLTPSQIDYIVDRLRFVMELVNEEAEKNG